jgi:thiol-disulfide isomerase/thioredoxin
MKKVLLPFYLLLAATTGFAQTGYEIKVTFKPYKNQYIYLGHYFGKTYPIIDSVKLNEKSEAVFKGVKKLPGGIYLVGYPNKKGFFEVLVDKQQRFSIVADTATIRNGVQFINSPDNTMFRAYQRYMEARGKEVVRLQENLKNARLQGSPDSSKIKDDLVLMDKAIAIHRDSLIKKNPNSILSAMLVTMKEPQLTGRLKEPKNRQDSIDAFNYFKTHYWEGVNFWDGRLAYTTFFEEKVDKYFAQLVVPDPDSTIRELDRMLVPAMANTEMTRFLLVKFVNRYLQQKYMWEDAVFVHLFEKYFAQKTYPWLDDKSRKTITDRAYSMMANIMGTPAADIDLPDSTGQLRTLYSDTAAQYTLVAFWDPTCGHCKEVLPKLDSFYRAKWMAAGLNIYAVAKETDGTRNDWLKFVGEQHLTGWTHVYYSKEADKARTGAGIPGYSQLYDVLTYPTLYLLDKNKRIIAKKLSYEQMDEVLDFKLKGQ